MKYEFEQTSNQAVRRFTVSNIGTGFPFRSGENLKVLQGIQKTSLFSICLPGALLPQDIMDATNIYIA